MRIHHLTCFGLTAVTLGLVGCVGGQTGDLSGNNDGAGEETAYGGCDEHKQELASFDEMTGAGSANQLLAYAERAFEQPLLWKAALTGQAWSVGPESGESQIHIDVVRGQSAYLLTYSPRLPTDGSEVIEIGVICPPTQLGVEAHVEISSHAGALSESYDTLLRSSTAGVAQLSLPFDPAKVNGELTVSSSNPQAKLVQLRLEAAITSEGTTGSLAGLEQVQHGSGDSASVSANSAVLAIWPGSEACLPFSRDGVGLGVSLEGEALGVTGAATLASVIPAEPQPITWHDGEQTTLSIGIEASGDGCLRVGDGPVELGGGPSVSYPVVISFESADGRLDGAYEGTLVATGSGAARRVTVEAALELAPDEVDQSGFSSVSVPASADSLLLRVEATLEDGTVAGVVRLQAITDADCSAQAPAPSPGGGSAPGCPGQMQTPLEVASWSN